MIVQESCNLNTLCNEAKVTVQNNWKKDGNNELGSSIIRCAMELAKQASQYDEGESVDSIDDTVSSMRSIVLQCMPSSVSGRSVLVVIDKKILFSELGITDKAGEKYLNSVVEEFEYHGFKVKVK